MRTADTLVAEWNHEMATTRRVLERVPDETLDWRPHPRAFTVRELATHLVTIPVWVPMTVNQDSLDLAPPGGKVMQNTPVTSRAELLQRFDDNVTGARAALAQASDQAMEQPWTLLKGGATVLTMPRAAVLRGFIFSHAIHHRAQLALYLRLLDLPVPAIYGQSADEASF
jgi:uncharacterized damage-inducible protein DinB